MSDERIVADTDVAMTIPEMARVFDRLTIDAAGTMTFTIAGVEAEIKAEMYRRREWLNIWYGPRCEDFDETCIVCRVHKNQDDMEAIVNVA